MRGVLRLYYKSRFSSYGSSACPRRTTFVLQKIDFPSHGSSGRPRRTIRLYYKSRLSSYGSSACPRRTTFVLQKSTFQPRKLRASPAYYICTTKLDFPATEVPGVLRLYYTSRKTNAKNAKNTTVLAPRPRENPQRGYVCMTRNAKTRGFWHRANAATRRGVTFVCQKRPKHDGFGTAPTPKPAEGCLRPRKKVPKTTVLAPRPGDHPQRVVRGHKET